MVYLTTLYQLHTLIISDGKEIVNVEMRRLKKEVVAHMKEI
jgi:hypothetical protein